VRREKKERESKQKEKKGTETTVLWTPVPFPHRPQRCTETAARAIKKKDLFYLPLLLPIPSLFASEISKDFIAVATHYAASSSCTD